jgi:hypothetical protein
MVLPKMTVAQKREFLVEMCNCKEYLKTDVRLAPDTVKNKVCNDCTLYFLPHKNESEKHFEEVEDLPRERG